MIIVIKNMKRSNNIKLFNKILNYKLLSELGRGDMGSFNGVGEKQKY